MVNTEIRLIIPFAAEDGEALYIQQTQDLELTVAHNMSFLLKRKKESEVIHSCPTLCDPMDCSLPGSSIHGILQTGILEWVAISWIFPTQGVSCILGRGCLLWPGCSLGKILLVFALLHFVLQGQACLLLQISLDFLLLHSSPLWWKGHVFLVLVPECLIVLHRTIQLQLLWH